MEWTTGCEDVLNDTIRAQDRGDNKPLSEITRLSLRKSIVFRFSVLQRKPTNAVWVARQLLR